MNVLVLEPYCGGSHRAFLDGWRAHSRHAWTVFELPARKWKWRMRHAALTLAQQVHGAAGAGQRWDVLLCSDMLNLAEFLGLAPHAVRQLPTVVYFHENQLTYPFRCQSERDLHFGFTNMTTAAAATQVWFNSAFHRDDFLTALTAALKRMPDFRPLEVVDEIRVKSSIHPPGVELPPPRGLRKPGPLGIVWAARWEHDKNPGTFFAALRQLKARGVAFRVSVVGEQFRDAPPVFDEARQTFRDEIERWGYQPTRADYVAALTEADVFVSTADHEFFGISAVEALAAGCYPLLPRRLAYPELLGNAPGRDNEEFLYGGRPDELAERLIALAGRLAGQGLWQGDSRRGVRIAARFSWTELAPRMDDALATMSVE